MKHRASRRKVNKYQSRNQEIRKEIKIEKINKIQGWLFKNVDNFNKSYLDPPERERFTPKARVK